MEIAMRKILHLLKLGWSYKISKAVLLSHPPYQYTIEPTNECNLKCDFCPQSDPEHGSRRPIGRLSPANLSLFLDRISRAGLVNKNINFTLDGEPFINKDFISFVGMAAERGYFSIFASNGIFLNAANADHLIAAGPFRASIDFASDEKIFEKVRGEKGHYDLVLRNLRYLCEKSKDNPGVQVDIHDISFYGGADPGESLAKMRAMFPSDLPPRIRFDFRQFHNFCGHLDSPDKTGDYRLCPYPWTQMAVAWNGDCVPCCRDTVGRSILGNVFEDEIMRIWNSEPYRRFRQNLIDRHPEKNAACHDCDLPYSGAEPRWKPGYILRSLLRR
jgi:radical SAM protein with 4Fe4S-binding SPASM domain